MKKAGSAFYTTMVYLGILAALFSGCSPKTTLYGAYSRAQPSTPANVTRLFMDRDGSIYPTDPYLVNEERLRQNLTVGGNSFFGGYLQYYLNYREPDVYRQLKTTHGIMDQENKTMEWADLQYALQHEFTKKLNLKLSEQNGIGKKKATLVVLIHGFNVESPTSGTTYSPYKTARERIERDFEGEQPFHFLEVYWDGMHGSPFAIWTYAQANAVFAGLTLRGILSEIEPQFPLRILTHSLGATVAANALWNVRAVKGLTGDAMQRWWMPGVGEQGPTFLCFGQMRSDPVHYPTPIHPDLRLASIAPAQPGMTYLDFLDRTPVVQDSNGWYQRVIIGFNKHDYATNKIIRPLAKAKFGLGSTSLAVYSSEYGKYVYPRTHDTKPFGQTASYWINLFPKRIFYTGHGLENYLRQPPTGNLLRLLFEDAQVPAMLPKKGKKVAMGTYVDCLNCECENR